MSVARKLLDLTEGIGETPPANKPATGTPTRQRATTAPGRLAEFREFANEHLEARQQAESKAAELEQKLADFKDALPVRLLDSARVRRSSLANRTPESIRRSKDFSTLLASIEAGGGNEQPICVRPIEDDEAYDFEVVYGHRRLLACQQLKLPVKALVFKADDRQLFDAMTRENIARKDLSAYELGTHLQRALDQGWYTSYQQLATAFGITKPHVSRALAISQLPEPILEAFGDPRHIQFAWSDALKRTLEQDKAGMLERAKTLSAMNPRPRPVTVLARLTNRWGSEQAIELSRQGKVAARIRLADQRVEVTFMKNTVAPERLEELEKVLAAFLAAP